MIDINTIRNRPDWVKEQIAKRNDTSPIDEILAADVRRREILQEVETLRSQRNTSSREIGRLMGMLKKLEAKLKQAEAGQDVGTPLAELRSQVTDLRQRVEAAKDETRDIGDRITVLDDELRQVEETFRDLQYWVPNLPDDSTPVGPDESFNRVHPAQGAPEPQFDFEPRPHWDLGVELDIIDFERGVKLSGSRFYLLKKGGARLQRAVIQFMLDMHTNQHGYEEIYPPFIVRSDNFLTAGQLPKFYDNIYRDAEEDFMWLGTAEIALTNLHRDEILAEDELPLKYVAYTKCWRREKMSAGKDVRGIKRGHEFDKVEMYQFVHPDTSYQVLEEMLQYAKDICDALGFH